MANALKNFLSRQKQSKWNKDKNQFTAEQIQERDRKRDIVKNKLYPLLLDTSLNIEDAKMFIESVAWVIKSQFDNKMKEMTISDLKLINMMSKTVDEKERLRHERILELFDHETIASTLEMIQQMPQAIDSFVREKNSKTQLSELDAKFL